MPLEAILKLRHTDADLDDFAGETPYWTADTLLSTYASAQGFITAKAGRPDLYRAGAYIMRQLHSSVVPWGFRPPSSGGGVDVPKEGIYLGGFKRSEKAEREARERVERDERDEGSDSDEDRSEEGDEDQEEEEEDEDEDEAEDEAEVMAVKAVRSAFAMLMVEGESDEDDDESQEESDG